MIGMPQLGVETELQGMRAGHYYIGWLRDHGLIWFRVEEHVFGEACFKAKMIQVAWRSDGNAQATRMVFEDPRAMAEAVLHDTTWWAHIEKVHEAGALPTTILYNQIGWSTEQPWVADRMSKES